MSQLPAHRRPGVQWRSSRREAIVRETPQETPIALSFDGRPHTVLMATPADVEDLAVGFTVTEAVASFSDIAEVRLQTVEAGVMVDVRLRPGAVRHKARPRTLEGRSSCGLCGVQRLADAVRPLPRLADGAVFRHEAVQRATDALADRQPLGQLTRATHAAAFADRQGALVLVREDVGRHNALDKLAGALARAGRSAGDGFVVVTSRCSFEMVEKAARIGAPMLVAVSAPTDLAIQKAEEAGLTLVALARDDGHTVFTRLDRLHDLQLETA
jgi:FdhD protein